MTSEIRLLWLLTALCLVVLVLAAGSWPEAAPLSAIDTLLGPASSFTTRGVSARDFLVQP